MSNRLDQRADKRAWSLFSFANIRDVFLIIFLAVVTYKLALADWNINLQAFGFTDLLSLLVAFFAIGLSVAFYFKATDTSNRFYDNSYMFTKDVSEILGRMEAGFGEKLTHLNEGYSGILDKVGKIPLDFNTIQKQMEAGQEEIELKEQEKSRLLEELAEKAALAGKEKEKLFSEMERLNAELETAKNEKIKLLKQIEHGLFAEELGPVTGLGPPRGASIVNVLQKMMETDASLNRLSGMAEFNKAFKEVHSNLSNWVKSDLRLKRYTNPKGTALTDKGFLALRKQLFAMEFGKELVAQDTFDL